MLIDGGDHPNKLTVQRYLCAVLDPCPTRIERYGENSEETRRLARLILPLPPKMDVASAIASNVKGKYTIGISGSQAICVRGICLRAEQP